MALTKGLFLNLVWKQVLNTQKFCVNYFIYVNGYKHSDLSNFEVISDTLNVRKACV